MRTARRRKQRQEELKRHPPPPKNPPPAPLAPPPPSVPYRPPPQLPPEVVDLIVEQVSLPRRAKQLALARCCLVSKVFLTSARPRLYRVARVEVGWAFSTGEHQLSAVTVQFVASLHNHQHLRLYVTRLEVLPAQSADCPDLSQFKLDLLIQLILQECPRITELAVSPDFELPCAFALARCEDNGSPAGIERLQVLVTGHELEILITAMTGTLRRLDLDFPATASLLGPQVLTTSHLSHISINTVGDDPNPFVDWFFQASAETLTNLAFHLASYTLPTLPSLDALPNLQNLTFFLRGREDRKSVLQAFPLLLSSCRSLRTFSLSSSFSPFTLSNVRTLSSPSPTGLAANLPSSLVALHLYSPHFYPSDLLSLVRASPQAVNLRQLGREPYRLPLGKRDRKKRPNLPSDEEIDELNEACRARGIAVVALPGGNNE
ncbi:hypothetical protein JCM8097_002217 [Rhodosporidiobolus ruineniae]